MAHIKSSWLFTFQHFPLSCMPSFSLLSCCVEPESAYINVIAAVYLSAQDAVNIIYAITTEAEKSGLCCVENCKKIFFYICCGCMFIASQSKLQKWKSSQNSTWTCFLFFLFAALMVCLKANTIYTGAAILLDETQASNSEVLQNPICILTLDPLFCCLHLCVPLLFLKTYIFLLIIVDIKVKVLAAGIWEILHISYISTVNFWYHKMLVITSWECVYEVFNSFHHIFKMLLSLLDVYCICLWNSLYKTSIHLITQFHNFKSLCVNASVKYKILTISGIQK